MSEAKRRFSVEIDPVRCRSCAVCWDPMVCEPLVLGSQAPLHKAIVLNIEACTGCRHCEWLCPDWAIVVRDAGSAPTARESRADAHVGGN